MLNALRLMPSRNPRAAVCVKPVAFRRQGEQMRSGMSKGRLIIAVIIAAVSLFTYYSRSVKNPVTGESQHIDITPEQEIALGLRAAPEMAQQFGGEDRSEHNQALVEQIGESVVSGSKASTT